MTVITQLVKQVPLFLSFKYILCKILNEYKQSKELNVHPQPLLYSASAVDQSAQHSNECIMFQCVIAKAAASLLSFSVCQRFPAWRKPIHCVQFNHMKWWINLKRESKSFVGWCMTCWKDPRTMSPEISSVVPSVCKKKFQKQRHPQSVSKLSLTYPTHTVLSLHLIWGFPGEWLCVCAVICTRLSTRSRLSFSKATNWIIKGALYTPISRRRQGEEGSLGCIRGKRRKTGWYTSNHSERLMCARWGHHAL